MITINTCKPDIIGKEPFIELAEGVYQDPETGRVYIGDGGDSAIMIEFVRDGIPAE